MPWVLLIGVVAFVLSSGGVSRTGRAEELVVNCFDETSDIVETTLIGNCDGTIVTDEKAEEIRNHRRDYIRRVLSRPAGFAVAGKRLASIGSGFFVADDGSLLTNNHVVESCHTVSVSPTSGETVIAISIESDQRRDLALIRTDLRPNGVARFAPNAELLLAMPVALVGYPDRGIPPITPLLSSGEIVRVRNAPSTLPLVAFKADVRRGNSGGPLLDESGMVVGVVFAKIDSVSSYKKTGFAVNNIGFAIPIDFVLSFLGSHGIRKNTTRSGPPVSPGELLNITKPYMARVGCWR